MAVTKRYRHDPSQLAIAIVAHNLLSMTSIIYIPISIPLSTIINIINLVITTTNTTTNITLLPLPPMSPPHLYPQPPQSLTLLSWYPSPLLTPTGTEVKSRCPNLHPAIGRLNSPEAGRHSGL
jgi:hypothetical protein